MDGTVRAIERRRMVEGGPEAVAQLLVARVRTGEISEQDVALAAYLGHPVASSIAGRGAPRASQNPRRWARGLARHGEDVSARAVLLLHQLCSGGLDGLPDKVGWMGRRERWFRSEGRTNPDALPPEWDEIAAGVSAWQATDRAPGSLARERVIASVAAYDALRLERTWFQSLWPVSHAQNVTSNTAHEVLEAALVATAAYLSPSSGGMTNRKWGRSLAAEALRAAVSSDLLAATGFASLA